MMMRVPAWCTKSALSALFILGLTQGSANASQVNIVAVDGTLCDLTTTLVGDAARVTCLIPPGGNPHAYQMKPSDRQTLAGAALVVHNGFNLTPSVRKISSSGPIVAAGEVALPGYSGSDPHVWHDPKASAGMIRVISSELKRALPAETHDGLSRRTSQAVVVFDGLSSWEPLSSLIFPKAVASSSPITERIPTWRIVLASVRSQCWIVTPPEVC